MIPDENGRHVAFVHINPDHRRVDPARFVAGAKRAVDAQVNIPDGTSLARSGRVETMLRVNDVSIAVRVGLDALLGLRAGTGVFLLLVLDLPTAEALAAGRLRTTGDLVAAIVHGTVKRVRLKAMTVTVPFVGRLSTLGSTGTRSDLVMRSASPMVGGLVASFLMEVLVYPAIFFLRHRRDVAAGSPTIPGLVAAPAVP